jgi:hypothetical protein
MNSKKAIELYQINNVTEYNTPITTDDEFFTDFTGLRQNFSEKKIFKSLNIIKSKDNFQCQDLNSIQRIFLSGHRGTGKTTELLRLKKEIDATKCFLTIFCDVGDEELDLHNIDFVDVIIFMIEKLVKELNDKNINIKEDDIKSFYDWYAQRIEEINIINDKSAYIEAGVDSSVGLMSLFEIVSKTRAKFKASQSTKDTIRRVFANKFSDFSAKFNEFILNIKQTKQDKGIAQNLLFVVDGFEKIGTLEDRRRIIIDNSNKFIEIRANIILTLPIELFAEASTLSNYSKPISFPLIDVDNKDGKGKEKFKEFIYKRIDKSLFKNSEDESIINEIIKYGAGSPRETLKIIKEAYIETDSDDYITFDSVIQAKNSMSKMIVDYLTKDEIEILKEINQNKSVAFSDTIATLLVKKVLLDYGEDKYEINSIIKENDKFKTLIDK